MNEVKEVSAAEIFTPILKDHPRVNWNAVRAAGAIKPEVSRGSGKPVPEGVEKDKAGELFDAKKHYSDQYGRPQYTKGGYFRRIPLRERLKKAAKRAISGGSEDEPEFPGVDFGKKPEGSAGNGPEMSEASKQAESGAGKDSSEKSYIPPDSEISGGSEGSETDHFRASAKNVCEVIFTLGISLGGPECKPLPQHKLTMESSFERLFRERGVVDVPPGVAVCLSTGAYLLFCYNQSKQVQEKARGFRGWIVRKFAAWKAYRVNRKMDKGAGEDA